MKLLVTGASGFLGSYVVSKALEQGHQVKAVVRPQTNLNNLSWTNHPAREIITLDLTQNQGIVTALDQIDAVIHLAAAKTGDYATQYQGTVVTTENLLAAMSQTGVTRLIAISTFSVYDYLSIPVGTTLDENSPRETNPQTRDIYAQTKLIQEEKYREFAQAGGQVTIIRPGMIYGKDYLWNACLGNPVSEKLWLRIGNNSIMPLIYVENCAEAIILAVESDTAIGETINLVDDDLPTQKVYVQKLQQISSQNPASIVMPLPVMLAIANLAWFIQQKLLQGKAKIPGILIPSRLNARFKPLNYSNQKAKQVLNWQPSYSLEEALAKIYHN
ncbi:MAG: NAD-dependent epimerase/dehydratase family protein [Gloeocapsa sp. DLM2.Bin57]|nr:MAG: NAD-dependent epimerase/dehydratase family protein [Gloeocapsa sp. DLM2.Bin57]